MDFAARDNCLTEHFAHVADAAKDPEVAADSLAVADSLGASAVADILAAFAVVDIRVDSHNQEDRCNRAASVDSRADSRNRVDNHSRVAFVVVDNRADSHNPEDNQADNREASAAGDNQADSRAASAVAEAAAAAAAVEVAAARLVLDAADTKPATVHVTPSSTRWTYRKTQRSVRGPHPDHWEPVLLWELARLQAASPPFECPAAKTNEGRPAKARHRQMACSTLLSTRIPRLHKVSTWALECHRFPTERSNSIDC